MASAGRRIALRLQYDGAPFAGSQRQRDRPTVQSALESAAEALTGCPHRIALAGRTDAGVHALGQVAAFTTASALSERRWVGGLNRYLPPAVAVQAARAVPAEFDPRRAARERTYRYWVRLAPGRQPLWGRTAWVLPGMLDLALMRDALGRLTGRHDFASFAGRPGGAHPGTVRTLAAAGVRGMGGALCFEFRAESFLPHQVRRTVGQVVEIGRGKGAPALIDRLLAQPRTGAAGPAAPPHGCFLVRVRYDEPALAGWDASDDDQGYPER